METTLRFPQDTLRFLHWVFFKPITLQRYIQRLAPGLNRDPSLWAIWRRSRQVPELRSLMPLALTNTLIMPWFWGVGWALLLSLLGFEMDWLGVVLGVALGVVLGVAFGVVAGIAMGVAGGIATGMAAGTAGGLTLGVLMGVALGVLMGVALGVLMGVALGVALGVAWGVAWGMVGGVLMGLTFGVAAGVAVGVAYQLSYFRLPLYLLQALECWLLARLALNGRSLRLWRFSPLNWDELIWFPLPGLDKHLIAILRHDRTAGEEALATVAASFRQGWAARNAAQEILLEQAAKARSMSEIARLVDDLAWLPPGSLSSIKSLFGAVETIAGHARAATESEILYNRQEQLKDALKTTEQLRRGLAEVRDRNLATRLGPILQDWQAIFQRELDALWGQGGIPNVYIAGSPLSINSKVFKGRSDIFQRLESLLESPASQRPALLLYGGRRMGKTSAIKQLPIRLGPRVIPVEVDLQEAGTVEGATGLFSLTARKIQRSALEQRRLELPGISIDGLEKDAYYTFQQWITETKDHLGDRWVLLCLDEYEAMEEMIAQGRLDERILQLLRGLAQHHAHLTLLFSGSRTPQELPDRWSHHFVQLTVVKIGPLNENDARQLITHPIPDFLLEYEPAAVDEVLHLSGCQPYLIQLICQELVNQLNTKGRNHAKLEDVQRAAEAGLTSGLFYFDELWRSRHTSDLQRNIMAALANAPESGLPLDELTAQLSSDISAREIRQALNSLVGRDILGEREGMYHFQAALVRRWMAENAVDE